LINSLFKDYRVKFIFSYIFLCFIIGKNTAQSTNIDSGTFIIHKFAQSIGGEKYASHRNGELIIYNVDFKYTDRGSPVRLKDTISFTHEMEPLSYRIRGGTSRFSSVDDSVVFDGQWVHMRVDDSSYSETLSGAFFPIAGYSPATAQMLLIQYWVKHQFPAKIYTPPFGVVSIQKDGVDTISFQHQSIPFIRYHITGLVWGNEFLWTNPEGHLVCLITNDAEGDKQEMMYEPYESLLSVFIKNAAVQGMRLFALSLAETKPSAGKYNRIAIMHATLLDVVNNKSIPDATVIIENGKIRAVGKSSSIQIPKQAYRINATGKTILPGLWDMHAHFEQAEWGPAYLAAGVTTVRDCGNEFDYINAVKNAIDEGDGVGPRILKAGIIDGKGPFALGVIQADTRPEAIAAVRRYQENGFSQIKIYSSVKPAIVKDICTEAHRLGMTVTGHVPFGMNLEQAIDSGMDMVNHIDYVYEILKRNKADGSIDFADSVNVSVMKFLKSHHLVVDPTLGVYELVYRSVKENITGIEPKFASLPEPLKPLFANTGSSNPQQIERGRKIMASFFRVVYALHNNGIIIVAGTDMGFPGFSLFRELELYVAAGLTPMEAIQSATIVPARVMGLTSGLGSIEAGKKADLILVDGNPLENIRNIRKVSTVIKGGQLYDPVVLHKMAGFD
jgi:imidazolonepropionase-like amidohydrolase